MFVALAMAFLLPGASTLRRWTREGEIAGRLPKGDGVFGLRGDAPPDGWKRIDAVMPNADLVAAAEPVQTNP